MPAPPAGLDVGPTPWTLPADAPAAAQREWAAWLKTHGVPASAQDALASIARAEVEIGRRIDGRVSQQQMRAAMARSAQAATIAAHAQRVLFGFTYLRDVKLALSGPALAALAQAAVSSEGDAAALLSLIDRGPGAGQIVWTKPTRPLELVASLVRQVVLGGGASVHLQIGDALRTWLDDTVQAAGIPSQEAMGGAGAFCANLASTLATVTPSIYAPNGLPPRVARGFSPSVNAWRDDGTISPASTAVEPDQPARINYAAEYKRDTAFSVLGRGALQVDGRTVPLVASGSGRLILGTTAQTQPGFTPQVNLSTAAIGNDLMFLVGPHYLTKGSAEQCGRASDALAAQLGTLRSHNPDLWLHWQYVVPKSPDNEPELLRRLRGAFDSTSLNSCELEPLLARFGAAATPAAKTTGPVGSTALKEDPRSVFYGAEALLEVLNLRRVHVHGFYGDMIVADGMIDPERETLALLRARQVASMKAANDSGEIKNPADLWPIAPIIEGTSLAAVHIFADAIAERFHLTPTQRDTVARNWWYRDTTGRVYMYVPSRGIQDFTGGSVSLGDTIDSVALLHRGPYAARRHQGPTPTTRGL